MNIETTKASQIATRADVKAFLTAVVITEGLSYGFHPDTPFNQYIVTATKERCYTDSQATWRDNLLSKCFDVVGEDVLYEILEEINPISKLLGEPED